MFSWLPRADRRSPRNIYIVCALVVALAIVIVAAWLTSSAHNSSLKRNGQAIARLAEIPQQQNPNASAIHSMTPVWTSQTTDIDPEIYSGVVVVPGEKEITAFNIATGEHLWSYSRTIALCALGRIDSTVFASFNGPAGCGDVTALNILEGTYVATRSAQAPRNVESINIANTTGIISPERVELWRDDAVRTIEIGHIYAPSEPFEGEYAHCTIRSAQGSSSVFAVMMHCPTDDDDPGKQQNILSLQAPTPEDSRQPEEIWKYAMHDFTDPQELPPELIAVQEDNVLVYFPGNPEAQPPIDSRFMRMNSSGNSTSWLHPLNSSHSEGSQNTEYPTGDQILFPVQDQIFQAELSSSSFGVAWHAPLNTPSEEPPGSVLTYFDSVTLEPRSFTRDFRSVTRPYGLDLIALNERDLVSIRPGDYSVTPLAPLPSEIQDSGEELYFGVDATTGIALIRMGNTLHAYALDD